MFMKLLKLPVQKEEHYLCNCVVLFNMINTSKVIS